MQQGVDINGATHRSRGYAIDIDALLHFAFELTLPKGRTPDTWTKCTCAYEKCDVGALRH